jgi:predicted membrane metal-binding protein
MLQLIGLCLAAAVVWNCFRRPYANATRILIVMAATMLAAPHVSTYDLTWLAVAACLLALRGRHELKSGAALLLLFLWLAPLINPPRAIPLGLLTPMLVLGLVIVALRRERPGGGATIREPRPSVLAARNRRDGKISANSPPCRTAEATRHRGHQPSARHGREA